MLNRHRADPVLFAVEALGITAWREHPDLCADQIAIFRSIFANKRTAVPSGHKTGKTFSLAAAAITFLFLYPDSKVITTAPTDRQVRKLLWGEIHALAARAAMLGRPLGGELLDIEYRLGPGHFAIGFSTDRQGQGVQAQGWSGDNILFVLDEAAGIPRELWNVANTAMQSPNSHIVAAGNPVDPATAFYDVCKSPAWNVLRMSSLDSPNAKVGSNVVPGTASREWCNEMLAEHGEQSPEYQFRVLGIFPDASEHSAIRLGWCLDARMRPALPGGHVMRVVKLSKANTVEVAARCLEIAAECPIVGCDVARYGNDRTVIVGMSAPDGVKVICVDDTGVGGGVTDQLQASGANVLPINFGEEAAEDSKYANRVTEMYFTLADDLEHGNISGLPEDETADQLVNRQFGYKQQGGRIKRCLESKDKYRERHGRSPDEADALLLANYGRHFAASGAGYLAQVFV